MADEQVSNPQPNKGKLPWKTIIIVAIVMVAEAGGFLTMQLLRGGPADVEASQAAVDELKELEKPVEVLVLEAGFNNNKTGRTMIYDTKAYIVVQKKYEKDITAELASMKATLEEDMRTIIGRADPAHLGEPTLSTLKRQFRDALDERLKPDAEGKSRVLDVRISRFIPIRAD